MQGPAFLCETDKKDKERLVAGHYIVAKYILLNTSKKASVIVGSLVPSHLVGLVVRHPPRVRLTRVWFTLLSWVFFHSKSHQ